MLSLAVLTSTVLTVFLACRVGTERSRVAALPPIPSANAVAPATAGNLGGVPVQIPARYAHFVEYDGDPNFMQRRRKPIPERTLMSGIRSFGFEVGFDEVNARLAPDLPTQQPASVHKLFVGVNSNSYFGTDQQIVALVDSASQRLGLRYQRTPDEFPALESYKPLFDPAQAKMKAPRRSIDLYVHRNTEGEAEIYIECRNNEPARANCNLHFLMTPGMRTAVKVSFPRRALPHWSQLTRCVRAKMLEFRLQP